MNETFEYKGHTFKVEIKPDYSIGPPWEEFDDTGPVSEWTRRGKMPGEWVLSEERFRKRYYDFAEAVKKAKREGWDAPPYGVGTAGERAVRAVTADFERLRRWCNDEWIYVTLHVTLLDEFGDETEHDDVLGGIEYDYSRKGTWMCDAQEMAEVCLYELECAQREACIDNRFKDAMECGV